MTAPDDGRPRLWYTRRDGEVRGPFPLAVIQNHILLGRIHDQDELSSDGMHWRALEQHPELIPEVMRHVETPEAREALRLARLRADERRGHDRRSEAAPGPGERREAERRRPETVETVQHRLLAEELTEARRFEGLQRLGPLPVLGIVLGALVLIGLFFWLAPAPSEQAVVDCRAPAAAGVNWRYCNKAGADLAGADLRGADLSNTVLVGVDLRGARLAGADLRYADLSAARLAGADLAGADLTGAVATGADLSTADLNQANLSFANLSQAGLAGAHLAGARLHRAIWVDGRVCGSDVVGDCAR